MKQVRIGSGRRAKIHESCRIAPGEARIGDASSAGAIRITGRNIEVDFSGFRLSSGRTDQARYKGIGVLIENSENVAVRNLMVSGYKYNILVRNSKGILLSGCDASGSYMKPLLSGEEYDKRDWLDIFRERIWRRYGAGISIEQSRNCRVQGCEAHGSGNGLWLVGSSGCLAIDNDFSHNTGWGIWMWKSCGNTIVRNKCDWCVRCENPGRYSKGGDSAGIMLSNGNCRNVIAHNSMRHGGDGFFINGILGTPGSNENMVAFNDGSHSPHNAFESTESRGNRFIGNIASNSGYGFYLGGSTHNQVIGNVVENTIEWGVSFDTGHDNVISGNEIRRAETGISLWGRGKGRIPSRNNSIVGNVVEDCGKGASLRFTHDTTLVGNTFRRCESALEIIEGSSAQNISLNNFIRYDALLELGDAKDITFSGNFCGLKAREAVLKKVKLYEEAVLDELHVDHLRPRHVKHEAQPVYASFANKSARKDRRFLWHTDMKKLVGHAETYIVKIREQHRKA